MRILTLLAAVAGLSLASPALAVVTLTFEGVGDYQPVGAYYGPEFVFSPDTLAIVDSDAGGGGNIANEPSANTVMFFLNSNNAILNVTNGFTTGFSFFYSSSVAANVNVYEGLNGTGALLASLGITNQYNGNNCGGDPNGGFCNWTAVGGTFNGIARSIDFGGTANQTAFDDITFGSATAGDVTGAVPEPSTWAMMLLGFGAMGVSMRRRRRTETLLQAA